MLVIINVRAGLGAAGGDFDGAIHAAISKGFRTDAGQGGGQGNGGDSPMLIEGIIADGGNALLYYDGGIGIAIPGRFGAGGIIGHGAGAVDGERACRCIKGIGKIACAAHIIGGGGIFRAGDGQHQKAEEGKEQFRQMFFHFLFLQ